MSMELHVPGTDITLSPGDHIRIGRFDTTIWTVGYGWYAWGGNRPVCGWYLTDYENASSVRPLQKPDLDDIYAVDVQGV